VLGTVQDGGLPHAACSCDRCELARRHPERRRLIASLAILLPDPRRLFMIDATPDVREQLAALSDWRGSEGGRVDRSPLDGVLLTHAHIGHYTGLAFFGFEAIHARELPVYCTSSMAGFLSGNGPWSQLVQLGNISLREIAPGSPVDLGQGVTVEPLAAPHRHEYTDTIGYIIRGPRRTLLYVPDTDAWSAWDPPLTRLLDGIDVALLDGTFYSLDELPGRAVGSIGHPLITDSMEMLQPWLDRIDVYFTHLNHSNPVLDPDGAARARVVSQGFEILDDGHEIVAALGLLGIALLCLRRPALPGPPIARGNSQGTSDPEH
jgi:pyrroloquinoline quinone biosynthesis protein B